MKISKLMGITKSQYELDFFDYIVDCDTYKFFDPYYIAKSDDPFLKECHDYISTFFNRFLYLLENGFEKEALELFSHLGEVNEICLGMSKGKPSGKGIGSTDALNIFNSIKESEAFKTGTVTAIEDLRLYIPGIDKDKVSDMIANIIKKPLIHYTQQQCRLFGVPLLREETGYYWNKDKWDKNMTDLFFHNGRMLLLYPLNLITQAKYFSSEQFFKKYILEYLQEKHIQDDTPLVRKTYKKGKLVKKRVYKTDIIKSIESKGEKINKDWLARFAKENPEIYSKFRKETISRIIKDPVEKLPQADIEQVIDLLITELKLTASGDKDATKYHHLISGILELLFFPSVAHPRLEQEIHEGRKRIDIAFDNIAENGFFFRLGTLYDVPCNTIMIECKNYSKDITNPELDQMSGRFSAKRGKFGIICCRSLDKPELFIKREQDTYRDDRGMILHLTDNDIINLLELRKHGVGTNEYLQEKYSEIICGI